MSLHRHERPTLEGVARHAGVSRATVSRVVNGIDTVADDLRDIVMASVRELGYVPNPAARSLVTQRTDSFAFVVPEVEGRVFSDDAFFVTVMQGVGEELAIAGKQLVLILAATSDSRDRIERYARGGHIDGVIITSMHGNDSLLDALSRSGIPVVASGKPLGGQDVAYVDVDHRKAVHDAVSYLIESGRRHIATIAGPQEMIAGVERLKGYLSAIATIDASPVIAYGDFTRESGTAAMRELLDSGTPVDAVFAASDLMADGALRAIRQAGLRVPQDVAVIGFDDTDVARYAEPPLTTVRQPLHDMGVALARQVLGLSARDDVDEAVILPTELIIREST